MYSVWAKTAKLPHFAPLKGDLETDVLIIGGGMAGILCAHMLSGTGVRYALVESGELCGGVTGNTTAKITSQHGLIYAKLVRSFGVERARMYLEANEAAVARYRDLCRNINCGFSQQDAFVYSRNDPQKPEKELSALSQIGAHAGFVNTLPLPFPVAGAVRFSGQAQFHPLEFASAIVRGLRIYEHTKVLALEGLTAITNGGRIRAEKIIVATHFPFLNKHGSYFLKLYQHRSYVLALEHGPEVGGMYVDEAQDGLSFRNAGNLLLLGGNGHRTGKPGGGWQPLAQFAARHYPEARECCRWATQDCMSLDHVPYIGHYSANTPSLFVATGFNKWGMSSSMVAAMLLTDLVMGKENPYAPVFSPSRTILRPQLAANAFKAVTNLLTPGTKRCPHMGCALKWNPQEHSWDCPCHGSRFSADGTLIDNPATGNLKKSGKQK